MRSVVMVFATIYGASLLALAATGVAWLCSRRVRRSLTGDQSRP